MKILYCPKCGDLFKLTHHELRECRCKRDKVKGKYRGDGKHAEVSKNAVSIKIPNGSIKKAIRRMERLRKDKPKAKDKDYKAHSPIPAWVRPNNGPGNRRTHPLEDTSKGKAGRNPLKPAL
jgi:hypothetical protein